MSASDDFQTKMAQIWGEDRLLKAPTRRELHRFVAANLDALAALAERVKALEAHGVRYVGNYQRALAYKRGDVTTHGGSMWVALRDVSEGETPGKAPDAWQLSAKARST